MNQNWTINQNNEVLDERGQVLCQANSHSAAARIVLQRTAALAGHNWIWGNGRLKDVRPVFEQALQLDIDRFQNSKDVAA